MTDFSAGPIAAGVCQECGHPTGDRGSLCPRCVEDLQRRQEPLELDLDDEPFLLDEEDDARRHWIDLAVYAIGMARAARIQGWRRSAALHLHRARAYRWALTNITPKETP